MSKKYVKRTDSHPNPPVVSTKFSNREEPRYTSRASSSSEDRGKYPKQSTNREEPRYTSRASSSSEDRSKQTRNYYSCDTAQSSSREEPRYTSRISSTSSNAGPVIKRNTSPPHPDVTDFKNKLATARVTYLASVKEIDTDINVYTDKIEDLHKVINNLKRKRFQIEHDFKEHQAQLESEIEHAQKRKKRAAERQINVVRGAEAMSRRIEEKLLHLSYDSNSPSSKSKYDSNTKSQREKAMQEVEEKIKAIPCPPDEQTGGINLLYSSQWNSNKLKNQLLPPAPEFMGSPSAWADESLHFDPENLPPLLIKEIEIKIKAELDCSVISVEEYAAAIKRLGLKVERFSLQKSFEVRDEETNLFSSLNFRRNFRENKIRKKKETVQFYIKNRAAEFYRAADKHAALMCEKLGGLEFKYTFKHVIIEELQELLNKLWWILCLDRGVSNTANFS